MLLSVTFLTADHGLRDCTDVIPKAAGPRRPANQGEHDRAHEMHRTSLIASQSGAPVSSPYPTIAGRRVRKSVAFSNASATRKTAASWNGLPTICSDTGSPSGPKPEQTHMAG